MASSLIYTGSEPLEGLVEINPGTMLLHGSTTYGDVFPESAAPYFKTREAFIDEFNFDLPPLTAENFSDPEVFKLYAEHTYAALDGNYEEQLYDTCYLYEIYEQRRVSIADPNTSSGCDIWTGTTYDYKTSQWWPTPPVFDCDQQPIFGHPTWLNCKEYGYFVHPITGAHLFEFGPDWFPPSYPVYRCGYGYYTIVDETDDCDSVTGEQFRVPITQPDPTLPSGVDDPPPPRLSPPPVLNSGITENTMSDPGYAELVPEEDGSYTLNIGVPCPCTDGEPGPPGISPTFSIGTVEVVPAEDAYVTLSGYPDYVMDFGIPEGGTEMEFQDLTFKVNLIDEFSGEPYISDITVQSLKIEDKNQDALILALFEQVRQLRLNSPIVQEEEIVAEFGGSSSGVA